MTTLIYICGTLLVLSIFFSVYRMIKGPTPMDRTLSIDGMSITVVALMSLLFILWKTAFYVDLILIFSILGFFSTVAFSFFIEITHKKGDSE